MTSLYPYQQKIVDTATPRSGIWVDCGLGKSAITIHLAKKYNSWGKTLVVTTKSLKRNWVNEFDLWWSEGKELFTVVSKEEFRRDHKKIPHHNAIIFDEAHFGAYYTNQIHKAFKWYQDKHKPACVWLATATPILANCMSVWGLSLILGRPLGSFMQFRMKYFRKVKMGFRDVWIQKSGIQKELTDDLKRIGVTMSVEEAIGLPDTVHKFEYFQLTPEQKRAIKDLDKDPTTTTPIVYANKCLQIANGTLKKDGSNEYIKCEKLTRVIELVDEYKQCVIVCKQTAELEMLRDKIKSARIYDGNTSQEERDEIVKEANEGKCVMLLQGDSGTGFNLTNIRIIIFYSHSWSYTSYYQSLGRNGGIRQGNNKNVYIHLITEKTIDEQVWKSLENKKSFDAELYNRLNK